MFSLKQYFLEDISLAAGLELLGQKKEELYYKSIGEIASVKIPTTLKIGPCHLLKMMKYNSYGSYDA